MDVMMNDQQNNNDNHDKEMFLTITENFDQELIEQQNNNKLKNFQTIKLIIIRVYYYNSLNIEKLMWLKTIKYNLYQLSISNNFNNITMIINY